MVKNYWFFNHGFKYQDSVCNGCHDLLMLCVNISDVTFINIKALVIVVLFTALSNLMQLIY